MASWRVKRDLLDREVLHGTEMGRPTALVVDDDEGVQTMLNLFLKKAGFSRVLVGSGKDALIALNKQKFDFCFLDLQLPDSTGDDIYQQAKAIDAKLPIVIVTGYPDSQILDNILKYGPVTVLKKPMNVDQLLQVIHILGFGKSESLAKFEVAS